MAGSVMTDATGGPFFFTGDDPLSVGSDLLNTVDLLATPADRLTLPAHLRTFLSGHGYPDSPASAADLAAVRRLREQLRAVWQAPDEAVAAARLNSLLGRHRPSPRLLRSGDGWRVGYGDRTSPVAAMVDDVLAGLAYEVAANGITRLGTCDGDPCRCAYLDRSRNRSRRYCCEICTNRAASAAYRQRARSTRTGTGRDRPGAGDADVTLAPSPR